MSKKRVPVLLGLNLNMIGTREKDVYDDETSQSIEMQIHEYAESLGFECGISQSNQGGVLIDKIHGAKGVFDGVVLNAGALVHYSYALRDAVTCLRIPFIETHVSNVSARESFCVHSVLSEVCAGVICGFGKHSHSLALQASKSLMQSEGRLTS